MLKNYFFAGILKVTDENSRIRIQDPDPNPDPDPSVRGMDLRIRIHPKMSWIRNTAVYTRKSVMWWFSDKWIFKKNKKDDCAFYILLILHM